jgi:hypothetical protein
MNTRRWMAALMFLLGLQWGMAAAETLFEDGFDSLRPEWQEYEGTWVTEDGYLKYIPPEGTNQRYWVPWDGSLPQDYTVELIARFAGPIDGGYAILVRMEDATSGYSLQYDPGAGGLRFGRFPDHTDIFPLTPYPIDADWHHLKITVTDGIIEYYIDGTYIGTAEDHTYPEGGFGVTGWRSEIWFDWFRVTTPDI